MFISLTGYSQGLNAELGFNDNYDQNDYPITLHHAIWFSIFKKLINGISSDYYKFFDFDSILKFYEIVKQFNISKVKDFEIPFAIKNIQGIGGYGFSINRFDYSINYISFNEYDYNGGTVYNKAIFKYSNNIIEFIENQIMIKQFE